MSQPVVFPDQATKEIVGDGVTAASLGVITLPGVDGAFSVDFTLFGLTEGGDDVHMARTVRGKCVADTVTITSTQTVGTDDHAAGYTLAFAPGTGPTIAVTLIVPNEVTIDADWGVRGYGMGAA